MINAKRYKVNCFNGKTNPEIIFPMTITLMKNDPNKEFLINVIAHQIQAMQIASAEMYKFSQGRQGCKEEQTLINFRNVGQRNGYFVVYLDDHELKIEIEDVLKKVN